MVEISGLAVLPSRLKDEMELVKRYVLNEELNKEELDKIAVHIDFADQIKNDSVNISNVDEIVNQAMVDVFVKILEDCAIFKESDIGILKDAIKNL